MAGRGLFVFVLGLLICFGVFIVAAGAFVALLIFLARRGEGPGSAQLQKIIEDWAEEHDYELLDVAPAPRGEHPFADKFGFGKPAGIVRRIKVRTRKGCVRRGWVYVRARLGGRGYSGFRPETLEVAWED